MFGLTKLQTVLFVWIYASICEEALTRGLLQGLLSPLSRFGASFRGKLRLSVPVILSALFFGGMHAILVGAIGGAVVGVVIFAVLLGLVAGKYRERTGSLVPAIIVHALFNVGGALPIWLIGWVRG